MIVIVRNGRLLVEGDGGTSLLAEVSDGFHTFDELYEQRHTVFIALCRHLPAERVWRSKLHHDQTMYAGWFILGIDEAPGQQITYHLPLEKWPLTEFATTLEQAPLWDGHTATDVLERLGRL